MSCCAKRGTKCVFKLITALLFFTSLFVGCASVAINGREASALATVSIVLFLLSVIFSAIFCTEDATL